MPREPACLTKISARVPSSAAFCWHLLGPSLPTPVSTDMMSYPPGCLRASFNEPYTVRKKCTPATASREGERRAGPARSRSRRRGHRAPRPPTLVVTPQHPPRPRRMPRGGTAGGGVGHLVHIKGHRGAHTADRSRSVSSRGCVCQCVRTACTRTLSIQSVKLSVYIHSLDKIPRVTWTPEPGGAWRNRV